MNLLDLAQRQRWSSLAARATTHPEEIVSADENGFTPLHWACFNQPSGQVVHALLNAAASAKRGDVALDKAADGDPSASDLHLLLENVALMTDLDEGMTPLHAACSSKASPNVVSILVSHCPSSAIVRDRTGWTPLHFACHTALAVLEETEASRTLEVVRILVNAEPTVVLCADRDGSTPLDVFMGLFGKLSETDWTLGGRVPPEVVDTWFWSLASLIIRESWAHFRHEDGVGRLGLDDEVPALHQIAMIPPPQHVKNLVSYVAKRFPDQPKSVDMRGSLPLHVAAAGISSSRDCPDVIRALLAAHPAAVCVHNGSGQMPLSVAIKSGRTWGGGVKDLLLTYPEALMSYGVDCTLYPVLIDKIASIAYNQSEDFLVSWMVLFRLLRSNPELCEVHR